MAPSPRRRQIALFLVAVILPSVVLVALGVQLVRQERQLALQQAADEHQGIVERARQSVFAELERLQRETLAGATNDSTGFRSKSLLTPPVVFAARVEGSELRLPWAHDPRADRAARSLRAPPFAQRVADGRRAEFADHDVASAIRGYESALRGARDTIQMAYARLLLGRALAKSGQRAAAESQNRRLLALPSSVRDDIGIPMALYAAGRLAGDECCDRAWIERVAASVEEPRWHSPSEAYLLRDLLKQGAGSADSSVVSRVPDLRRSNDAELAAIERALALREAFAGLGLRSSGLAEPAGSSRWVRFDSTWLVSTAPIGTVGWGVVAVALDGVPGVLAASSDWPRAAHLTIAGAGVTERTGEQLDPAIAGVSIVVDPDRLTSAGASGLRRGFYVVAVLLVVSVTLFGAYVFWFDVRRELRIAELRAHFVSSVSHELKTPLTAIRMFAERLRMKQHPDTRMQAQYLDTIVGESERLTRLIDNVLDLSKIEQEKRQYRTEPVLLGEVVERARRALGYPLARGGFTLHVDVDARPLAVRGDADALEQALLNLLSNAMKYSGDSREIDLRLSRRNGEAVIEVVDRGVGIPDGARGRLTETFFRVATPGNERIPGTGLGLALVQHTLDAHGGRLTVSSQEGKGSTFAIHLPLEAR